MNRQPRVTRSNCGRHRSAFNGKACSKINGHPDPGLEITLTPSVHVHESFTLHLLMIPKLFSRIIASCSSEARAIAAVAFVTLFSPAIRSGTDCR